MAKTKIKIYCEMMIHGDYFLFNTKNNTVAESATVVKWFKSRTTIKILNTTTLENH